MEIQKPINVVSAELFKRDAGYSSWCWCIFLTFTDLKRKRFRLKIRFGDYDNSATILNTVRLCDAGWIFGGQETGVERGGVVERDLLESLEEWWQLESTVGKCARVRSDMDVIKRAMDALRDKK